MTSRTALSALATFSVWKGQQQQERLWAPSTVAVTDLKLRSKRSFSSCLCDGVRSCQEEAENITS